MPQRLVPQLLTSLGGYTRHDFLTDLLAGVIVGIVALPLAIAFAIASGVTPAQGLYTAIIAGFVISALGGSRVQIGGPTGAFVVIVYGIVQQYGFDGLAVATLMAGVLLVALGFARLGAAIKFIPLPGDARLHRGHRDHHRVAAGEGRARADDGRGARAISSRRWPRTRRMPGA